MIPRWPSLGHRDTWRHRLCAEVEGSALGLPPGPWYHARENIGDSKWRSCEVHLWGLWIGINRYHRCIHTQSYTCDTCICVNASCILKWAWKSFGEIRAALWDSTVSSCALVLNCPKVIGRSRVKHHEPTINQEFIMKPIWIGILVPSMFLHRSLQALVFLQAGGLLNSGKASAHNLSILGIHRSNH